ncbi:uncharacterized protein CDAR_601441 [Caerostris darwini]|uniref:Transmembrane protein n=1 Tax=Caerostris darwini TaxID=1538125 RepID=A0AAV4V1T4_9ARAC|nr:uncharacterized protein CDAR_601441 [Caerostris darwini]
MKYINSHVIFYTAVLVFAFLSSGTLKITQGIPIKDPGTLNLKTEVVSNRVNDPFVQPLFGPTEAYGDGTTKKSHEVKRYPVASFDFDHVAAPFVITAWIFAACCAKIGMWFHLFLNITDN